MSADLKLAPRLDLCAALDLVSDLRAVDGDIRVDATEVTHMGALCLQALIAASIKVTSNGGTFEMANVSDKVVEQMALMGMTPDKMMEGA